MAVEIAGAGYGLGEDVGPVFPGRPDGSRAADAITLRSNPGGIAGALREDLAERDTLVDVDGAALFAAGDDVLLADDRGTVERARVSKATSERLAFRSVNGPEGQIENRFLVSLDARVLKVREVGFSMETDRAGVAVVTRQATGQAAQVLARYADALAFAYLDEGGSVMDPDTIGPGVVPRAVRVTLRLDPNPDMPRVTVPVLSLRVPLEAQSATVPFDAFAFHRIGVAGIVGQDPVSGERKVGMHGWRKSDPRF
jgi:hypothetical protein